MSRIGKLPITIPSGVTITVDDELIKVDGPKGSLSQFMVPGIKIAKQDDQLIVTRKDDTKEQKSKHGLMRSLVNNMIIGVTKGFEKKLEINGVGFRANLEGSNLKMQLGFSHDIVFKVPEGIKITVEQNIINVSGISKQQVGQTASEIRAYKKPEPYKGKGIKYVGERIIRKSGKSGKDK